MPIIKSAKKRVRTAAKATERNRNYKRIMRDALKSFQEAVKSGKSADIATARSKVDSTIDTAVKKNIIHKNKAARKKTQIAKIAKDAGAKIGPAKTKKAAPKKAAAKKPAAKKSPAKKAPAKKTAAKKTPAKKPATKKK